MSGILTVLIALVLWQPARVPHHIEDRREHWSRYMDPLPKEDPMTAAKKHLAYLSSLQPSSPLSRALGEDDLRRMKP